MEKSIESIWKEGFLKSDALVVPKINDLYNQKSQHIIEKFKRLGKRNLYGIVIGATAILVGSFFIKIPMIGGFIFVLLISLVLVGIRQGKALEQIDNGSSSYHYLKAFNHWLNASVSEYGRIYQYVYPLLFLAFVLGALFSSLYQNDNGETIIEQIMNKPSTYFIYGLPVYWILGLVLFIVFIALISKSIYRFDLYSVYGRIFKKLEELMKDMEELRNEQV